jgi:ABC-type sugar transport system permease subunit
VNDPRAKMEGNRLLALGAPQADWTKAPGRVPGFWVALLGLVVALVFPVPALLVAAVGLAFTLQARRVIPAGAKGSGLTRVALGLTAATVALVVLQVVLTLV